MIRDHRAPHPAAPCDRLVGGGASSVFRLALVSMPWAMFNRPSIQLAALKSYLEREESGLAVNAFHPCLGLARHIGSELYRQIALDPWLSEGLFAGLLFPERRQGLQGFLKARLGRCPAAKGLSVEGLWTLLPEQFDTWLAQTDWSGFDLIGFSVCFNQLLASLWAAARLKKQIDHLPVVFGGSSCAGGLGQSLLASFPQIDHLVSGEGEVALLDLCRALAEGRKTARVVLSASPVSNLDFLPTPDYRDYFAELRREFAEVPFIPELPIEFSRGCWWNKCAFCNLNLQWQGYRAKSVDRMVEEVLGLVRCHAGLDFFFTDNVLPLRQAGSFFQKMSAESLDLRFFAEIRIEQRGRHLADFRAGGLVSAQSGIEALSQSLLDRMDKGATVIDNLALMKDALALGIQLDGNLIAEFPGSSQAEVDETLEALDFVLPFTPLSLAAFFLGHGSGVAKRPADFQLAAVSTHRHNRKLFPAELAKQLDLLIKDYRGQEPGEQARQRQLWRPVREKLRDWRRFHQKRGGAAHLVPALSYRDGGDFLLIRQEQLNGPVLHHRLKGSSREIYLACGEAKSLDALELLFPAFKRERLIAFLDGLRAKRLLFAQKTRYLALAVQSRKAV